jgi:hypothetical protein
MIVTSIQNNKAILIQIGKRVIKLQTSIMDKIL